MQQDDKDILLETGRIAGETYERLLAEAKARKDEEIAAIVKVVEEDLVISEEQQVTEEDE